MNSNSQTPDVNRASGAAIGFMAVSVIFVVLAVIVRFTVTVPAIDANRGAVISESLYEIRTNEVASLHNAGWVDRSRGIVRLPIDTAMKIAEREWKSPEQARADLVSRVQRATAPAPKPAATSNPFE
jgi:hypothetical protein